MHPILQKELENVRKKLGKKRQKLADLASYKYTDGLLALRKEFADIAKERKNMSAAKFLKILDEMSIKEEKLLKIIKQRDKKGICKIIDEEVEIEQAIYELNLMLARVPKMTQKIP